ncbi:ABC transporter ATP-binding protein [Parasphaerochaeta coccoides]|uniref:ABC transporter related protein n=1 Tax=Parasphaerochaeta coccoides (strain ATCC BAA-1237 / DSM 17374 / SPN1) TaxID=760011 RepID=F4GJ58_PARC1|nr:ABC transporter ATP-binding protein [Parasphaerochaeta coccoides]AEC01353.1 ABC transporter related protein [Parasphaerochaeta coccoides DSM 17374]
MALLELENVTVDYGSIHAIKTVNIEVETGEVVTLIGANGAGKSTLMKTVMGLVPCKSGKIKFNGIDITNKDTQYMVQSGIILSPEGRQVFPRYSVRDNLLLGAYQRPRQEIPESLETVYTLLPKLKERNAQMAGSLSGGEQQMLAIGRAMMGKPRMLLMDEPSLGLAPLIITEIFNMIDKIRMMGTTILLVEQNARIALKHSDRAYVLEAGSVVLTDRADCLLNSDEVRKAYFGGL